MVYSYELEQQFLGGLLNHPEKYMEIASFITSKDFVSDVNGVVFTFLKLDYEEGNYIDEVVLAEKIKLSGISFEDNINISEYSRALKLRKGSAESIIDSAKELAKLTVRRGIGETGAKLTKSMKNLDSSKNFTEIIDLADSIYNDQVSSYELGDNKASNIFEEMEQCVEDKGNNPQTEFGPKGPHERLHELYGSLLRPGNITTLVARTGVGKTQFVMDFCVKVSAKENIPVLHLDNGEMSKEELMMRQCASLAQVPMNLLETGQWRQAGEDVVNRVRSVWKKIKEYKLYYQNVGGMPVDSMIQAVKHFYYGSVGRGNPMILSFDYIKTTSENSKNKSEWQIVGEMVDKFKKLIQRDITTDGLPSISMMTSVQSNRSGITNNRSSENIVEDESIVSLSDRITQFSSHLFGLRQKTLDELAAEPGFGTHKLTCFKFRHLGENIHRAVQPVRMPTGELKKNYINLNFENFNITEVGDLQDMIESQVNVNLEDDNDIFGGGIEI
jgi:replicative DNA helicase